MKQRSAKTTFTICKICSRTVPIHLFQKHLKEEHDMLYSEYYNNIVVPKMEKLCQKPNPQI